jgi:single-strand DNA-binding protein
VSDVQTTIIGYVGGDVTFREGGAGGPDRATFRVASTPRFYDKINGGWRDGETVWSTVSCWRALAGNVKTSVHSGDPVVVIGRRRVNVWQNADGVKQEREFVDAQVVCHDLSRGTSVFRKTPRMAERADDSEDFVAMLDAAERSAAAEGSPVPSIGQGRSGGDAMTAA